MKRLSFFALTLFTVIIFAALQSVFAQTIQFCENVDNNGNAINESTTFNIRQDNGFLYMLIKMSGGKEVNCNEVLYDIYKIDPDGEEIFYQTVYQDVRPDWNWFWQKFSFFDSGTYKIYVYDEDWDFISSGSVNIN